MDQYNSVWIRHRIKALRLHQKKTKRNLQGITCEEFFLVRWNQALSNPRDVLLRLSARNDLMFAKPISTIARLERAGYEAGVVGILHLWLKLLPHFCFSGLQFPVLKLDLRGIHLPVCCAGSFISHERVKVKRFD